MKFLLIGSLSFFPVSCKGNEGEMNIQKSLIKLKENGIFEPKNHSGFFEHYNMYTCGNESIENFPYISELYIEFTKNRNISPRRNSKIIIDKSVERSCLVKACIKSFLEKGANPNLKAYNGETALNSASKNGDLEVVQLLLDHKADINVKNNEGLTALSVAAQKGNIKTIQLLLENGANPNVKNDDGSTPLFIAIRESDIQIVRLLLSHKADPNVRDQKGVTPLCIAVVGNGNPITKFRSDHKDGIRLSDLAYVARAGDPEIVQLLLINKANPNVSLQTSQGDSGITPLILAVQLGNSETIKSLLEYKGNPNVSVNILENENLTPLHLAVERQSAEIIQLLLHHKADPNSKDAEGKTPLDWAKQKGCPPIIIELLSGN